MKNLCKVIVLLVGFLAYSHCALAQAAEVKVKQHAVIRDGPSGTAKSLGTAEAGDHFPLLSTTPVNSWLHIQYQGSQAWIYSRWVEVTGSTVQANSILLASFNTLHLGWGNTKDLDQLSRIMARYDLIALLEVMKSDPLNDIQRILENLTGSRWEYIQSPLLGNSSYKESYAYMWREDRVHLLPGANYVVDDSASNQFEREPYVAGFKSGNFDFILVALHSIWGDSSSQRRSEAKAAAEVFRKIQEESDSENDIILLGDFNLPPNDSGWSTIKSLPSTMWVVKPPAKTTIATTGLSSLYDNLWFQTNYLSEYANEGGAYNFVEDLFEGPEKYQEGRTYVSDHLPVWARFNTSGPDDD